MNKDLQALVEILRQIQSYTHDKADTSWSAYDEPAELREELEGYITALNQENFEVLDTLNILFAPTSTFQELSLSNDWSDEYLTMAETFDKIYKRLKKSN